MHIFIKLKVFSFVSRDPLWWSSRGSIRAKSSGGKRNDQTNDNSTWKNRTHRCTVSEDEKSFPLENEKTKVTKEIIFCIASATAATLLFGAGLGPCKAYCVFCWGQRLLPDACVGVPTNEMKRNNENTKLGSGYIVHIIQWMRGKTLLFCLCFGVVFLSLEVCDRPIWNVRYETSISTCFLRWGICFSRRVLRLLRFEKQH